MDLQLSGWAKGRKPDASGQLATPCIYLFVGKQIATALTDPAEIQRQEDGRAWVDIGDISGGECRVTMSADSAHGIIRDINEHVIGVVASAR